MEAKDKALKTALTVIVVVAILMVAYYWVKGRTRKLDNDLSLAEKGESFSSGKEEKSEFTGIYSATEAIEGNNRRFGFFSVNQGEGGALFGTAKLDGIGGSGAGESYLKCNDVKAADKEFFTKCSDPDLGQISFVGEITKGSAGMQVTGKFLWSKDGTEIVQKNTTLTHSSSP